MYKRKTEEEDEGKKGHEVGRVEGRARDGRRGEEQAVTVESVTLSNLLCCLTR